MLDNSKKILALCFFQAINAVELVLLTPEEVADSEQTYFKVRVTDFGTH